MLLVSLRCFTLLWLVGILGILGILGIRSEAFVAPEQTMIAAPDSLRAPRRSKRLWWQTPTHTHTRAHCAWMLGNRRSKSTRSPRGTGSKGSNRSRSHARAENPLRVAMVGAKASFYDRWRQKTKSVSGILEVSAETILPQEPGEKIEGLSQWNVSYFGGERTRSSSRVGPMPPKNDRNSFFHGDHHHHGGGLHTEKNKEQDQHKEQYQSKRITAAGLGSAVVGFLTMGPIGSVVLGFGAAYAAERKGGVVGDSARAVGDVTLSASAKAQEINANHAVVEKAQVVAQAVLEEAKEFDRKHLVLEKAKDFAFYSGEKTVAFAQEHKLMERTAQGIGRLVSWAMKNSRNRSIGPSDEYNDNRDSRQHQD